MIMFYFFFFKAEDGIRAGHVTGVQTCALPILESSKISGDNAIGEFTFINNVAMTWLTKKAPSPASKNGKKPRNHEIRWASLKVHRSEERRVGKECRYGGARSQGEREREAVGEQDNT